MDLDAVSIHGDEELDDIDKEIKSLSEGSAENSKKTPQKGNKCILEVLFAAHL